MDEKIQAEIRAYQESFKLYDDVVAQVLYSVQGPVARDLARRALLVESAAKVNASQPHRAGPNTGSAPGGGPAVRTGRLRGSITWRFAQDFGTLGSLVTGGSGMAVEIGTNVEYAQFVELGTSRMAARPFLRPALDAARG